MSNAVKIAPSERRRFLRTDVPSQIGINLLEPQNTAAIGSVNLSEGGVCLRLDAELQVRSLVRMQLTADARQWRAWHLKASQPLQCTGRVAWVIQRLDLRSNPPFLYDIGIEFVNPPSFLRQLMTRTGQLAAPTKERPVREKVLEAPMIRGRRYQAVVGRQPGQPGRWHLVVSVDGVPCFSGHYPSERQAQTAWTQFKKDQAKR